MTIHMTLIDVLQIINETYSPLMVFSFGITFAMSCVFVFVNTVCFSEFWLQYTWFALSHTALNVHVVVVMLFVLWGCEATETEGKKALSFLFREIITSNNQEICKKVS